MRAQLASLPPLCPAKLPQVSQDSSTSSGGPTTGIYRRTDQLLATLLKLSADVKVVDVTGKTAGDEPTLLLFMPIKYFYTNFCRVFSKSMLFLIQSAPACSSWSRRLASRTSAMLWTNSRFLLSSPLHGYRQLRDESFPLRCLFRAK